MSTLKTALNQAAGRERVPLVEQPQEPTAAKPRSKATPGSVLIGASYSPEVRRVLKLIEADTGRNLKQLLGEAINMLAAHHGKPEPWREDE